MARFQNACQRTLIFALLTLGTIFFVPVSALANGVITVTTPLNGATVAVPFDVHFTYSGTDTYTKLWIDGVAIISDHNGSVFDYTVTSLAAGKHTLSLQAHDATSNTTVEVKETITVSTSTTPTVTVTPSPETMAEGDQVQFSSGGVTANWTLTLSTPGVGGISGCTGTTTCTFTAGTSQGTATLTAATPARRPRARRTSRSFLSPFHPALPTWPKASSRRLRRMLRLPGVRLAEASNRHVPAQLLAYSPPAIQPDRQTSPPPRPVPPDCKLKPPPPSLPRLSPAAPRFSLSTTINCAVERTPPSSC